MELVLKFYLQSYDVKTKDPTWRRFLGEGYFHPITSFKPTPNYLGDFWFLYTGLSLAISDLAGF